MIPFIAAVLLLAAPPDGLPAEVARLVEQLDAAELSARESAQARLLELGPAALPLLPAEGSAEVVERLAFVRKRLQVAAADPAAASRVTLDARGLPLKDALAEIARQSGNRLADGGAAEQAPRVDLRLVDVPFWQAVDDLCRQTNRSMVEGDGKVVRLVEAADGAQGQPGAQYLGPVRLAVDGVRTLPADATSVEVTLDVAWEPRLAPIALRHAMKSIVAAAKGGGALTAENPLAVWEATVGRGRWRTRLPLLLSGDAAPVGGIERLGGVLQLVLPGRAAEFRFDRPAAGDEKRIASARVRVDEVGRGRGTLEVRLRLRYDDAAGALESHRGWVMLNPAWLVDRNGRRIDPESVEPTLQTDNEVGLRFVFAAEGLDYRALVYQAPADIFRVELRYEVGPVPMK